MLEKTSNAVAAQGVIGRVCVRTQPPRPPATAPPPIVPQPPRPRFGIGGAVSPPTPQNAAINYYSDTFGNCWRVTTWSNVSVSIYAPSGGQYVREPVDCSTVSIAP